jgi:hypothetical protein
MTLPVHVREILSPAGTLVVEIQVSPFSVTRPAFVRLAAKYGPALAKLAAGTSSLSELALASSIGDLLRVLDDADLEYVAEKFGPRSVVVTWASEKRVSLASAPARDAVFTEHGLMAFVSWVRAVLEVNYADFLSAAREAPARVGAGRPTPG